MRVMKLIDIGECQDPEFPDCYTLHEPRKWMQVKSRAALLDISTHDTTAISASLVIGVHPVLNAASRIRFQALSARPVTEKGCLAGVSSNCLDIANGKLGVGEGGREGEQKQRWQFI